jgi:hypothetical protein
MDVVGIISLTLQVVGLVNQAIKSFGRLQNAPKELRDFKKMVVLLEQYFNMLKTVIDRQGPLSVVNLEIDLPEIKDTLHLCHRFFSKSEEVHRSQGVFNSILRATWTLQQHQELDVLKAKIYDHYLQILIQNSLYLTSA